MLSFPFLFQIGKTGFQSRLPSTDVFLAGACFEQRLSDHTGGVPMLTTRDRRLPGGKWPFQDVLKRAPESLVSCYCSATCSC